MSNIACLNWWNTPHYVSKPFYKSSYRDVKTSIFCFNLNCFEEEKYVLNIHLLYISFDSNFFCKNISFLHLFWSFLFTEKNWSILEKLYLSIAGILDFNNLDHIHNYTNLQKKLKYENLNYETISYRNFVYENI
jgi:hypothetical protein